MDRPHFHEEVEIVVCVSGEGIFFLGSEIFPLKRGQIFLIGSSHLHRSVANEEYRSIAFHIAPAILQSFSTGHTNYGSVCEKPYLASRLNEKKMKQIEYLYKKLAKECGKQFGEDIRQIIYVLDFLNLAFGSFAKPGQQSVSVNTNLEKVIPILNYIQENLGMPLTTESIAKEFFMSRFYLCRLFKDGTGFGLIEYLINCRILKARALLRSGVSVQEAGECVGFNSNEHFIRTFKKTTGTTPKKYAMMYRETNRQMKGRLFSVE